MVDFRAARIESGATLCLECGKCSTLCPLAAFGGFSAARMIAIQDPEQDLQLQVPAVLRCLTCGSCELRCPQGVRFTDFVRTVRQQLPAEARTPCPHGEVLQSAARLMGQPEAPARDLSWVDGDLEVAESGEVALFVGCLPQFDAVFEDELGLRTLDIARAAIRVLNHLGIRPVLVPQERCCGHDLLWQGDHESFDALAKANTAAFQARGIKRILTTCAECARTWRLDYPAVTAGYKPRIEHFAEFMAQRLEGGELAFGDGQPATVTYHDPCRLGRHLGVLDPPRRVLSAIPGATTVEMSRSGRDALCCGTSGFIHCDAVSCRLQGQRLGGAAETGASKLLTACPKCLIHFACAQNEQQLRHLPTPQLELEDLTVFAAGRLVPKGASPSVATPAEQESGGAP